MLLPPMICALLAVKESSIGDLVTQSIREPAFDFSVSRALQSKVKVKDNDKGKVMTKTKKGIGSNLLI